MRVLALNGSARKEKGVTYLLLRAFCSGLEQANASCEIIQVADLDINPCKACLSCMHKTPGQCSQNDDMQKIYPLLKTSDLLILATPVYTDNMTAQLKMVMDRSIACLKPFLVKDKKFRVRHPLVWNMPGKSLLLATCGFPEPVTFEPLIATFRAQTQNFASKPVAELCVPGAIALMMDKEALKPHLELLTLAGKQLVEKNEISLNLVSRINQPVFGTDKYLELTKRYEIWCQKSLKRHQNKRKNQSDNS